MITLSDLNRLAGEHFAGRHVTLPCVLWVWAQADPGAELLEMLSGTGIDPYGLQAAVSPLIDQPVPEDRDLLSQCIMGVKEGPVTGWHILKTLADTPGQRITRALVAAGLDLAALRRGLEGKTPDRVAGVLAAQQNRITPEEGILHRYGRDLTALAREGVFDELSDREQDIDRLMEVLLKKKKGNAVLTGSAGVGKTALVELFARRIVGEQVPKPLNNVKLYEISMGKLLAGTVYRGMFEERLEKVIEAVKACAPAILFIDEMHLIWGAGRAEGVPMDAANMLKPVLARGEFRLIGATTVEEYHQYIRRDEALARRFEEIRLEEPDPQMVLTMVARQAQGLAAHHGLTISADIVCKAVELTNRYLPHRYQPDKSVDLLDTASVRAAGRSKPALEADDLLETLAGQTGRPIATLTGQDRATLQELAQRLKKRIIGQDQVMDQVARTLIYRRQDLGTQERNLGTFLFAGATGVGKTEAGRVLAEEFFGGRSRLLHLDLAEYAGPDTVNKLIGSPPGFAGSEKEGALVRFFHTHGSGVILCDEIEKAHATIHQLFLGLLDNGRMRSARGELLDARQCVIIVTTNAIKPQDLSRGRVGFGRSATRPDPVEMLSEHFPREFLGRFDEVLLFDDLGLAELREVLRLRLAEALERLQTKGVQLAFEEERLLTHLLDGLTKSHSGARGIARLLERELLQPISLALLLREKEEDGIQLALGEAYYTEGRVDMANDVVKSM